MSRMGVVSNCVLQLVLKQGFRSNSIRCLSSAFMKIQTIDKRSNQSTRRNIIKTVEPICLGELISYRLYSSGNYPDHIKVLLPALSPTMEMGSIVSWAKKEGDKLNEGDLLAEIETDKATMGFETPEEGYLAKILVSGGTRDVPVGKLVCIIVEEQSYVAAFKDFKDDGSVTGKPAAAPSAPVPQPAIAPVPSSQQQARPASPPSKSSGRVYASPMAKRIAETKQIRLDAVGKGSGLYGSLKSTDLPKEGTIMDSPTPMATPSAGTQFVDIPLSTMRSVIAKRLVFSKTTIPHYYLTLDVRVDKLVELRKELNKALEKTGPSISINDFIIKATALASKKVKEVNSAWMDTFIREYQTVDVSVAVSTDRGLITPIVFGADSKGLVQISKDVKSLAAKAKEGKLQPREFQGGTVSVSNLGMFGITHFAAVINPPQSCILAVGGLQNRMIPEADKSVHAKFITVTLSCDHRVVDGAVGARWLSEFRDLIENPNKMLL